MSLETRLRLIFDVSVIDIYTCPDDGSGTCYNSDKTIFCTTCAAGLFVQQACKYPDLGGIRALTLISALHGLKYRIPIEVKRVMFSGEVIAGKTAEAVAACTAGGGVCESVWTIGDYLQLHLLQVKRIFEDDEILPLGKAFDGRKVFSYG